MNCSHASASKAASRRSPIRMQDTNVPAGICGWSVLPCGSSRRPAVERTLSSLLLRCPPVLSATKQPPASALLCQRSRTLWYSGRSGSSLRSAAVLAWMRWGPGEGLPARRCSAGRTKRWKHTMLLTGLPAKHSWCYDVAAGGFSNSGAQSASHHEPHGCSNGIAWVCTSISAAGNHFQYTRRVALARSWCGRQLFVGQASDRSAHLAGQRRARAACLDCAAWWQTSEACQASSARGHSAPVPSAPAGA